VVTKYANASLNRCRVCCLTEFVWRGRREDQNGHYAGTGTVQRFLRRLQTVYYPRGLRGVCYSLVETKRHGCAVRGVFGDSSATEVPGVVCGDVEGSVPCVLQEGCR